MPSNGKSETFLPAPTGSDAEELLLDAWREVLAETLHAERAQWQRHRELTEAQSTATIAELRVGIAELYGKVMHLVADRLAQVQDGSPGPAGEKGDAGPPGEKGDKGDATMLPPELAEQVASAVRLLHELPPVASGRSTSGRVLRIERDEHGALVPIYDEAQS